MGNIFGTSSIEKENTQQATTKNNMQQAVAITKNNMPQAVAINKNTQFPKTTVFQSTRKTENEGNTQILGAKMGGRSRKIRLKLKMKKKKRRNTLVRR